MVQASPANTYGAKHPRACNKHTYTKLTCHLAAAAHTHTHTHTHAHTHTCTPECRTVGKAELVQ